MPKFHYTGLSITGKHISGELEAASRAILRTKLSSMKIRPIQIKTIGRDLSFAFLAQVKPRN
jgi:type II secretory pathway component PulF